MTKSRRNDNDRELIVRNHEGLFNWWRREMRGEKHIRKFIRDNRAEIDAILDEELKAKKPSDSYGLGYMQGRGAS